MKLIKVDYLKTAGDFPDSSDFIETMRLLKRRIAELAFNSPDKFVINPIKQGNGVKPISEAFCNNLPDGWRGQVVYDLMDGLEPGPIDVFVETPSGKIAIEWETGNVSSSHRALNKLAIGILTKRIEGGILVVPSRAFYKYLTDRVGNYQELVPYFPIYRNLNIERGVLVVIEVEHDEVSPEVPLIPKGSDGNSKKPRKEKTASNKTTLAPKKKKSQVTVIFPEN